MKLTRWFLLISAAILMVFPSIGQDITLYRQINWKGIKNVELIPGQNYFLLQFSGSLNESGDQFLPRYYEHFEPGTDVKNITAGILQAVYEPIDPASLSVLEGLENITDEIDVDATIGFQNKKPVATVSFIPLRKNPITGQFEKLTNFTLIINYQKQEKQTFKSSAEVTNSVLAQGNWYKMSVDRSGVFKLTYQNLSDLGMNVSTLDPRNIRIYGMKGGMLPENIDDPRADDLQEFTIFVAGEADGSFDASDYVLFYGQSPNEMKYLASKQILWEQVNYYSNYSYYFITADLGAGKRIETEPTPTDDPINFVNSSNDYIHFEEETNNLIGSGRMWFGQEYDLSTESSREYSIQGLKPNNKITLTASAAARSDVSSSFGIYVNNTKQLHLSVQNTNSTNPNSDFAKIKTDSSQFYANSENLTVKVVYTKTLNSSIGWLDYYNLNFMRDLSLRNGQTAFRNFSTVSLEGITEYTISKANQNTIVWNVTNPYDVKQMTTTLNSTSLKFSNEAASLQEFVAFDGSGFYSANMLGAIENQNLHALNNYDYIIVTYPEFREQAERLANFHSTNDGMNTLVVEPQMIYNEFSSGSQDVTAIRDFMKMLYDRRSPEDPAMYLLLFGDASYDYKDREENNTNYIPSWESPESLNPVGSYVKDDYYGLLDGGGDTFLDVGIGRFVVGSNAAAKIAVNKAIHYESKTPEVMGDWRNIICLVADDEDSNLHFGDAEELADTINTLMPEINIDKIYFDAYQQVSTPSGERYPDANLDLNNRINRGALIVNYVGHGGEGGLAHERVVEIADINSWDNYDNMPVFITATCEFSRFDDPKRTSAGEFVFLSSKGAGVALFTTTRATYAGANMQLNRNFYKYALNPVNGKYLRMGDVIRLAKNSTGSVENKSKFSLLGDPALNFAFPEHNVFTAAITNVKKDNIDTIQALLKVTISGQIRDFNNNKLDYFNGTLYPTVYDKPSRYSTLANDPASFPGDFRIQKNALYKGKAQIENGEWSFTFIAPKDIAYQFGFGKLSFYANNDETDANGYYSSFVVGGYNQNAVADNQGPDINLFINDYAFVNGGLTNENPSLLADIFDENGINTVGSGIGHDIIATLDENKTFVLNDYYEAGLDDYKNGNVLYPLYDLSNGKHTLTLRAWDIYNNSSVASIDFIVAESTEMAIMNLMNYPNPFKSGTKFSFEHNQLGEPLSISLEIFDLSGRLVTKLDDFYNAEGFKYESRSWSGTGSEGEKLQGMYIYRLKLQNADGSLIEDSNKLVILK
ncbi:MAG: type IX secretion system sortase PorU [Bacteroidales bacterium]|nr:type IX secretion system sortase PorU [Bacteroidales bacterium]